MANSFQLARQSLLDALAPRSFTPQALPVWCTADDAALAVAARQDCEAYAELYRRHATSVFRYMLAHAGNAQDAQDLTAQTFLAGLEAIGAFRARGTFAAWLFGIAYHKVMDYHRRDRPTVPLDQLAGTPHPDKQPDQVVEDRFDRHELTRSIRMLAPDRAEALTLRVFAELSVEEISELMGRSESAVRMLLSRAVRDLKRLMDLGASASIANSPPMADR